MHHRFYGLLAVAAATTALFWIVPEVPFAHLDDPSYWGVIGYAATVAVIIVRISGRVSAATERRWMVWFLVGMPVVYLADWVRFGGTARWLSLELLGLALYGTLAWMSQRRSQWLLPIGIGAHAAWDAAHYDRAGFVPNWYVLGCVVVDVGLGLYVALQLSAAKRAQAPGSISDAV